MANIVYIATSLDGYIADKNNSVDWLHEIPNPQGDDFGFGEFMDRIDALIMGRNTLDVVLSFGVDWPYTKPVYVLSNSMIEVPKELEGKVFLTKGDPAEVMAELSAKGHSNFYVDGGTTIQQFLKADLIDEMVISIIPTLLGGGIPLFGELAQPLKFRHTKSERYLDCIVKNYFVRERG